MCDMTQPAMTDTALYGDVQHGARKVTLPHLAALCLCNGCEHTGTMACYIKTSAEWICLVSTLTPPIHRPQLQSYRPQSYHPPTHPQAPPVHQPMSSLQAAQGACPHLAALRLCSGCEQQVIHAACEASGLQACCEKPAEGVEHGPTRIISIQLLCSHKHTYNTAMQADWQQQGSCRHNRKQGVL
jgi:hypothetical protein